MIVFPYNRLLYDMPIAIQHGHPIQNSIILEILKFLNYSYFANIMTRKPQIGNLTNCMTI